MRSDWTDLPEDLRGQIEAHTGPISAITPAPAGNHADIACTLHTAGGRTFVKAARKLAGRDGPEVMSLRREAAVNPHVAELAPRLRWQAEAGGWLALGFEHVEGRRADFSPGSPDLVALAKTIHALQATPCPDVVRLAVERRWQQVLEDTTPLSGNVLLHTDLNEDNFIITPDGRAYLVDWAFTSRGAAWVELGLLVPWLIKAGHSPQSAEEWVAQFSSWAEVDPGCVTRWSVAFAELWRTRSEVNPAEWVAFYAGLIRRWADHRLKERPR
ncbi:phosphotransferase [Thermomonospora cellulosilytica]|uniref:Aminoglycoside phosphotransferase domain-containing protein n=1 Tax=Thermomonospora cellulosilytica TaxID=1411118 RepID=A0A7W3N4B5_9ACTN|nr:phosphotransferase [Thermomonospora cellulosilytica]MBA9007257.1 hypothetical protein [Thermomonospora cellulosilytica]